MSRRKYERKLSRKGEIQKTPAVAGGYGEASEKLVNQYSKIFWTQIPQIPQISSMDRLSPRNVGFPMLRHRGLHIAPSDLTVCVSLCVSVANYS
jgi:hypothetical protein